MAWMSENEKAERESPFYQLAVLAPPGSLLNHRGLHVRREKKSEAGADAFYRFLEAQETDLMGATKVSTWVRQAVKVETSPVVIL